MTDRWRYSCPDCGSVSVLTRRTYGCETVGGGPSPDAPYYCRKCSDGKQNRYDKKNEVLV